jgi:hypothetical protein
VGFSVIERDAGFAAAGSGGTSSAVDDRLAGDTSGRSDGDSMTSSEERVDAATERQAAGRARLRQYMVTGADGADDTRR